MHIIGIDEHLSHGGVRLGGGMTVTQGDDGVPMLVGGGTDATVLAAIDGGGLPINPGDKGQLLIPFAAEIVGVYLLADQVGSVVVDIWKTTYALYPPTVANTITGTTPPTITAAQKMYDPTLTGWTKTINPLDTLWFKVNSVSSLTRVTVVMLLTLTLE